MRLAYHLTQCVLAITLPSVSLPAQTAPSPGTASADSTPAPDTSNARRVAGFLAPGVGIALGESVGGRTGAIVGGLIGIVAGVAIDVVEERREQVRGRNQQLCFVPGDPGTPAVTIPGAPGMPDFVVPGTPPSVGLWVPCR